MKSYVDVFIDPVTGKGISDGGLDFVARFIVQTATEELPNAQALDELENGIMRKYDNGVVGVRPNIFLSELPELGGTIAKGLFAGDVWRGTKDGKAEASSALSVAIVDIAAINLKFFLAEVVMMSSIFKPIWGGATFIDEIEGGLLYNKKLMGGKHKLIKAEPNHHYMQPDLRNNKIWFGKPDRGYDAETTQITAPWVDATYITQKRDKASPKSQALCDLEIGLGEDALIKVTHEGVIEVAVADVDYATKETLEELAERAEEAAETAEGAATEATEAAGEATTAAATATGAASEASSSALAAAGSVLTALAAAASAGSSSSSASSSANTAQVSAKESKDYYDELTSTELKLEGDIEGVGSLTEPIITKIKDNPVFQGSCITLAGGLITDRPINPTKGMLRYVSHEESSVVKLEFYNGEEWKEIV